MQFARSTTLITSAIVLLTTIFLTHTYTNLFTRLPIPFFKSNTTDTMGGGPVQGFRSVAYFVNWYVISSSLGYFPRSKRD